MTLSRDLKLFETCLTPFLPTAYGVAYYLSNSRKDAELLVAEAARRAFATFSITQSGAKFSTWFLRFLTQTFRERCGQAVSPNAHTGYEEASEAYRSEIGGGHSPVEAGDTLPVYFNTLTQEQIAATFAVLPEETRLVVALYFMEALSYRQIAETMGISLQAVRERLHHGRWELHRRLCYALQSKSTVAAYSEGLPA